MNRRAVFAAPLLIAVTAWAQVPPRALSFLVVGGAGRTGQLVVKDLLARGFAVRGLSRRVDDAKAAIPEATWFAGDVREPATLAAALAGVGVVVYAVGGTREHDPGNSAAAIYDVGVATVAAAAKPAGVRHIVLLSSAGVTPIGQPDEDPLREVTTAKRSGEAHMRASGLGYSIVRTYGVWDAAEGKLGILLTQGDKPSKTRLMTSRRDIARVLAECAVNPDAAGKSFEIGNVASPDPDAWAQEFSRLTQD